MAKDYPLAPLGKYVSVQGGFAFKSSDFKDSGVPVLKIKNVRLRDVDTSEVEYVAEDVAKSATRYRCKTGDLLISMTGSGIHAPNSVVGRVARFTGPSDRFLINQRVGRFVLKDPTKLDSRYLFYVLTQGECQSTLVSIATGSANQVNISGGQIESMEIPLPPLSEQRAIAYVLGTLDDKLDLNRQMNETLEAMEQALFKSWFVDPTENGLPEGWRESTIGQEVGVAGGSTPSTKNARFWEDGTIHWATPRDLSSLANPVLLDTARRISDAGLTQISSGLLPRGTVLLSSRAPIGYLAISEVAVAVNQGFIAMVCDQALPNYYVQLWARANMDLIEANANGTTFLEISKSNFRPLPVVVPPKAMLDSFVDQVEPLHQKLVANLRESLTLAALRDGLLPKLLSGELRGVPHDLN